MVAATRAKESLSSTRNSQGGAGGLGNEPNEGQGKVG